MSLLKVTLCSLAMATLVACGGGGGGAGASSSAGASGSTDALPPSGAGSVATVEPVYTGQYIDAPVKGLSYLASPSGLKGTTDASGNFSFQSGDIVTFNVVTPGGNINAGSVSPATPSSTSATVPVSVMSMSGGLQIAQALQSLGGTGSIIDVSSTNSKVAAITSSASVTSLNNFISTQGASPQPTVLTVTALDAFTAALNSLNSLPITTSTPQAITNLISAATIFYIGTESTVTVLNKPDASLTVLDTGIYYFNPDGSVYSLCFNGPVLSNPKNYNFQSGCSGAAVDTTGGKWVGDTSANKVSLIKTNGNVNVVNFLSLDNSTGIYKFDSTQTSGTNWTGKGLAYRVNRSLTTSYFAGKTLTIPGESECSDGYMNYLINSDGTRYVRSCKTSTATGVSFTSSSGTFAQVSNLPGVLMVTDSTTNSTQYFGQVNGGTVSSGKLVGGHLGDTSCYTSTSGNCGSITVRSYTAK